MTTTEQGMTITVEAEGNHVAGPMVKAFTEDLRQALERYRLENNLTLKELAIQLDSSPGQVSKYLSKKPEGDVVRLEAVIEDVLAGDRRKRTVSHQLFKTPTYKSVASALNTVRETNDIAVIYGHAGIGKTCAISLYCGEHSSVLDITATEDRRGAAAVCAQRHAVTATAPARRTPACAHPGPAMPRAVHAAATHQQQRAPGACPDRHHPGPIARPR